MNMFTNKRQQGCARTLSFATLIAMIIGAFPVPFFVAEAATTSTITATVLANPTTDPEYFEISYADSGSVSLDLENWQVKDLADNTYTFTAGAVLSDGDTYRVCQNSGATTSCDAVWDVSAYWNNTGNDSFTLLNADGVTVLEFDFADPASDETVSGSVQIEVLSSTGSDKVDICHVSEDHPGQYNSIHPNVSAFLSGKGHPSHAGDIIPFFYYDDEGDLGYFAGNNYEGEYLDIYNNDCVDPNAPVTVADGEDSSVYDDLTNTDQMCIYEEPDATYQDQVIEAADRLLAIQDGDGSWDWVVTGNTSPTGTNFYNITGVTAQALLDAYVITQDSVYLDGAKAAGDYLVANYDDTARQNAFNILFLYDLASVSGDATYAGAADDALNLIFAEENWWSNNSGSYCGTDGCTPQELSDGLQDFRSSYPGLAEWDLHTFVLALMDTDNHHLAEDMQDVIQTSVDAYDGSEDNYILGVAGALRAAVAVGDVTAIADNVALLDDEQGGDGGFSTAYGDIQSTAYAMMALDEAGEDASAAAAAAFLSDNFGYTDGDDFAGWLEDGDEYAEVNSEAIHALANFIYDPNAACHYEENTYVIKQPDLVDVVDGSNYDQPKSWFFYNDENDTIDNTLGSFVNGPDSAPLGEGSAQISVLGTERRNLATYQFSGTELADIIELKFSTYNPSAGNGGSADRSAFLNFNVDFDGSDDWQKRLAYVPSKNGSVTQDSWQEWDAIDGGTADWWWSGYAGNGNEWPDGNTDEYRSWDDLIASFPNIAVRTTDSWFGMRVGEPYADGYTENIDKFVFATQEGATTTVATYDFEPINYCSVTVVSDESNYVEETAANAALAWVHDAWTAVIDSADWIWGTEYVETPAAKEVQTFTKSFEWSGAIASADLEIATDNFYAVYINGDFVASSTEDGLFKEENKGDYNVASYIDEGVNTLEIVVTNKPGVDDPESNPAGLLYNLTVVSDEEGEACMSAPVDASLEITNPATDYEVLSGEYTFTAEYVDADSDDDNVLWAIRAGTCSAGSNTVAGNVDGYSTDFDWDGSDFSSTIDMTGWSDGDYCLVVNPQEDSGTDFRETRWFTLQTPVVVACEAGVNLLENPSFEEPVITSAWSLVDPVGWVVESVASLNPLQMEIQRDVNGWLASDGDQYAELDSTESSQFSQIIPTVLGATYQLAWDFAARPNTFQTNNDLRVLVDGVEVASDTAPGESPLVWRDGVVEFTGTGASTTITFADAGDSDTLGTFLDNTSLVCDPAPTAGPYCGDGEVNQDWEQCEVGDEGCTDYCTIADQCLDPNLKLAKITFDNNAPASASFDNTVYLGADDNPVPSGVWFSLGIEDATPVNDIADEVDGLAVRRSSSSLHLAVTGDNKPRDLDYVFADIEFVGVDIDDLIEADEFDTDPIVGWPLETNVNYPDVFTQDDNVVRMEWYMDVGNDAAGLTYEADPYCTEEDPTYVLEGYAWHDEDEDGHWRGFEEEEELEEEPEAGLAGWTVEATNGSTTYSTTTDSTGYYWFEVPAGTWTITEVLPEGWGNTTAGSHVVTVPSTTPELTLLDTVMSFIIPTAHAAIEGYYGPYNFGNKEVPTISTTSSGSSSSGSGSFFARAGGSPTPQVLGAQVSAVPSGAPNAGAGGAAPTVPAMNILHLLYVRRGQDKYVR